MTPAAPTAPAPSGPALTTSALTKRYGGNVALDAVDVTVPRGSVYGLVGPNGAGKTTLLSILAGLRSPTAGEVDLGVDPRRIAVVPDTPNFEPWMTGREVVGLSLHLTAPELPAERVVQALERAGIADAADRRIGGYSRGMLQRLGLAAAVVGDPDLLILDEPTSALDPAGRRDVLDFVSASRGQATVLFSSHILGDVQEVSDTVGILRDGRLLFEGPLDELLVGRAAPAYAVRVRGGATQIAVRLRAADWVSSVDTPSQDLLRVTVTSVAAAEAQLVGALAEAGATVVSLVPVQSSLEHVFLELTS